MAAWAGFSEDELRKLKKTASQGYASPTANQNKRTCDTKDNPSSRGNVRQAARPSTNNTRVAAKSVKQQKSTSETVTSSNDAPTGSLDPVTKVVVKTEPVDLEKGSGQTEGTDETDKVKDLDDQQALNRDLKCLEKFREQQKQIEEANKQKKALLAKTLTERKKAAQKEAYKLEHIQRELGKLDTLLTADVQVIRGKIEEASRDFMEAQKRFERAEAEYVAAKMELHDKQEMKEQLTEHLYTIIHQNEVRKAKKLADLMKTLEMEAGGEEELSLPELPPLTSFQPTNVLLSPTGSKHHHHDHHLTDQTKPPASEGCVDSTKPRNSDHSESSNLSTCSSNNDTPSGDQIPEKKKIEIGSSEVILTTERAKSPENLPTNCVQTAEATNMNSRSPMPESTSVGVDLGTVKTEPAEAKTKPEENSKSLEKTAWDFDGTVK